MNIGWTDAWVPFHALQKKPIQGDLFEYLLKGMIDGVEFADLSSEEVAAPMRPPDLHRVHCQSIVKPQLALQNAA